VTTPPQHTDPLLDELVELLVRANAGRHDLWGFLALGLARASSRVGSPHRLLGPRWDTNDADKILDLIRDGKELGTHDLIRWQSESIVETTYGETLTVDQVAAAAGVDPEPVRRALDRLADEGRIHRDGDGYRY
jgi:hypothetical protein